MSTRMTRHERDTRVRIRRSIERDGATGDIHDDRQRPPTRPPVSIIYCTRSYAGVRTDGKTTPADIKVTAQVCARDEDNAQMFPLPDATLVQFGPTSSPALQDNTNMATRIAKMHNIISQWTLPCER